MDSDSENDILTSNNVFTFQTMNTTVSAKGPNMTNITSLSYRNNVPTSTMYLPRNMEHSKYASSVYDQRSIHSRREVSPMSVRSAYDFQPRNFNMSHYPRGMSSQRSVMNGRSGSPMSMTSTTSVSAIDIAMALKNTQFNRHDFKIISEAYNKFVKSKIRKKFERKRNLRLFLKGARRRSGGESGEQGSDSSISDDDCRSNKTSLYKGNMSSSRSTKSDLTNIRRTMQESNIYNDCSANLKQKSFKNMFSVDSGSLNSNACNKSHNGPLQKDRFKSSFLLPSQRFNKTVAASTIPENVEKQPRNMYQKSAKENFAKNDVRGNNFMSTIDSEHEEIFAEAPVRQNQLDTEPQRKRILEKDEETPTPHKKRNRLSPIKNILGDHNLNEDINSDQSGKNQDEFIFAKPSFPIKKIANPKVKEKLIAKSPHVNNIIFEKNVTQENNAAHPVKNTNIVQEKEQHQNKEGLEPIDHSSTDISMRPSFIKRKLFTQKLDVAENKVLSSDHESSPKTVYGAIQKEKHKARKLVTNQSCLSRDVLHDDNYLDLIHKIVPPDQMNSTNQPNKSDNQRNSNGDDKWDVTSVISTCNLDNASDTYTDEDIFHDENNIKNKNKKTANKPVPKNKQECKVIIERVPAVRNMLLKNNIKCNLKQNESSSSANVTKNNMKSCAKSFWDTDLESDIECHGTQKTINTIKPPSIPGNKIKAVDQQPKKVNPKKTTPPTANISLLNNSTATVYKFNNTSLSIKSHRTIKKKKCCDEDYQSNATLNPTQNKQPASKDTSCLSYSTFVKNVKTQNTAASIPDKTVNNVRNKRSCRTPKQNTENTLTNENKTTSKSGANQSLRPRKTDTSSIVLDDEIPPKTKPKKQNVNTGKSNKKQADNTKPAVNSRKSDVSFTLNTDVKSQPVKSKKLETVNKSSERKSRPSNVSFSITSEYPMTRSRSASKSNEYKTNRSRRKVNHNISVNKDTSLNKLVIKTPNKREGNNGVINMVQDLKSNKSKVVRKR
ncbi:uncharacterized protein LOC115447765 [Manduca sexta]|uniref:Uncharacterized protein n=1 Tax=Manduca sexta TaxID=7130 RepID=A0A922CSK7_MANSE|nr:uncharacterized protein LOC115447765 [Manduca sexta]KAG6456784.1 hypothetical protein O3G_MSEX009948 [Manduca sexta]